MLSKYNNVKEMVQRIKPLLVELEKCLGAQHGVTIRCHTHRCLKVDVSTGGGGSIPADILPAIDFDVFNAGNGLFRQQ